MIFLFISLATFLNFKPLGLNTSLTACLIFFYLPWGRFAHILVQYRHRGTSPLDLDLWIWVLSVTGCINRNQFPDKNKKLNLLYKADLMTEGLYNIVVDWTTNNIKNRNTLIVIINTI